MDDEIMYEAELQEDQEVECKRVPLAQLRLLAERVQHANSSFTRVPVHDLLRLSLGAKDVLLQGGREVHFILEAASSLGFAHTWNLMGLERFRQDAQSAHLYHGLRDYCFEYVAFFVLLLEHLSGPHALANPGNLAHQGFICCVQGMTNLFAIPNDVFLWFHMDEVPQGHINQAINFLSRYQLFTPGIPMDQAAITEVTRWPRDGARALWTCALFKLGGLLQLVQILEAQNPVNMYTVGPILGLLEALDPDEVGLMRQAFPGGVFAGQADQLNKAVQELCVRIHQQIEEDPEKLAERERTFTALSKAFDSLYAVRVMWRDKTADSSAIVDREISVMQRAFILRMLRSTNFNNLLSAARECQRLLARAETLALSGDVTSLQDADNWLQQHNIIHTLLKANLHQRQYADLVLSILQVLVKFALLRTEHLDMLWAVTEAEGTFDVVKVNVYAMIQDLAAGLDEGLLNQLFNKFEVLAQGRSVADCLRLLDLLKKLATSTNAKPSSPDSVNRTAERLLALIWKLTMPVDAPAELSACDAMADVLRQYGGIGHWVYCKEYLSRCCEELMRGHNVYTALRVLRRLLTLFEMMDQENTNRDAMEGMGAKRGENPLMYSVLQELEATCQLQSTLVGNTLHLMEAARAKMQGGDGNSSAQMQVSFSSGQHPRLSLGLQEQGVLLPGYGNHTYSTILSEYLQTITYVASKQRDYYEEQRALQLWNALVLHPVLPSDTQLGLKFLQDGVGSQYSEFLNHSTKTALLNTCITQLPPEHMSPQAWEVFQLYFHKVNLEAKALVEVSVDPTTGPDTGMTRTSSQIKTVALNRLHGVGFIWRVALECGQPEVALKASELLIQVYVRGSQGTAQEAHCTKEFIEHCLESCTGLANDLVDVADVSDWQLLCCGSTEIEMVPTVPVGGGEAAAQVAPMLQRCLFLMSQAAEMGQLATLPLTPSHQSSFQAIPLELDAQVTDTKTHQMRRARLSVAPNDYVGTLRRAVAADFAADQPASIRIFLSGQEWRNDAKTMRQVLRPEVPRQTSLMVTVNPGGNSYTQPGPGYVERWKGTALALLAAEEPLYYMLLHLADRLEWPEVSRQAMRLLQLLPTCPWVSKELTTALQLTPEQAHQQLSTLLLRTCSNPDGSDSPVPALAQMTYWLQALHALLFPTKSLQVDYASELGSEQGPQKADRATLLKSMVHCLPVLLEVIDTAGRVMQSDKQGQQVQQVLDLDTNLVQLLANLSGKEVVQLMSQVEAGVQGSWAGGRQQTLPRPLPIDLLMTSPTHSPGLSGTGGQHSLGTPTGMLQALNMAGTDTDAETGQIVSATVITHATGLALGAPADAVAIPQLPPEALSEGKSVKQQDSECTADAQLADVKEGRAPVGVPVLIVPPSECALGAPAEVDSVYHSVGGMSAEQTGVGPQQTPLPQEPLGLLVVLLVRACCQAADAVALVAANIGPAQGDAAVEDAGGIVRDGLAALSRLLHGCSDLYSVFLQSPMAPALVTSVLLNTTSPALRSACGKALRDICLTPGEADLNSTYEWLLSQLLASRSQALQCSRANREFFSLLLDVVNMLPKARDNPRARELASQLLEQEIQALNQAMSSQGWLPQAPSEPVVVTSGAAGQDLSTPEGQEELLGRLKLMSGLMGALGGSVGGAAQQQALVKMLLERYLFPEAMLYTYIKIHEDHQQHQPPAQSPPEVMQAVHTQCATLPAARVAAFEVLRELMSSSGACMQAGSETINTIHCLYPLERLPVRKNEGVESLREIGSYCGLRNGGATCYINSVVQQLFMQPQVRALMLSAEEVEERERPDSLFAQLQELMAQLVVSCAGSIRPEAFWHSIKDYDGQPIDIKEHQDAYEFFTRLQDSVDSHLKSTGQVPALASVFGGKFVQQIISREGPHRSEREEEFYQISVDVKGKGNLQSSLESYVQGELMEGENAWHCEELGRKVSATRRMCIKQLPQSLVIHLKRFEYDHMANQRYKVRERFEFPEELDMYPYTAEALAAADKQQQAQRAAAASASQEPVGADTAADTGSSAEGASAAAPPLTADASMADVSGDAASCPAAQQPQQCYKYQLRGVVVHSGSAFAGHYYSYIQERPHVRVIQGPNGEQVQVPTQPGRWFHFDDKVVKPWDSSDLEEQCFGGPVSNASDGGAAGVNLAALGDRAYSAFLLFYDRLDGSCIEVDPVPSFCPPSPNCSSACADLSMATAPASTAARLASGGGVGDHSMGGVSIAADPVTAAASGTSAAEGPYGMSLKLYYQLLVSNLELLRRHRAFDKHYAEFMHAVCEQRVARASNRSSKARRTKYGESGVEDVSFNTASGDTPCGSGGSGAAGSVLGGPGQGASQSAAVQRDVERVQAAEEVAALGLDWVLHVLFQSPLQVMMPELQHWQDFLKMLLDFAPSVASRVVDVLLETHKETQCQVAMRLLVTRPTGPHFHAVTPRHWIIEFLIQLQLQLCCWSNVLAHAYMQQHGADDLDEHIKSSAPVVAHRQLLNWLVTALCDHHNHLQHHPPQRRRGPGRGWGAGRLIDPPFQMCTPLFALLGQAIALDALAMQHFAQGAFVGVSANWVQLLAQSFKDQMSRDFHDTWCVSEELTSALGLLGQVLVHAQNPALVWSSQGLPPDSPAARPPLEVSPALLADLCKYPEKLPHDPGPPSPLRFPAEQRQLLPLMPMHNQAQCALASAVLPFINGIAATDANPHLLMLLSWNHRSFSLAVMTEFLSELQNAELDSADTDDDLLGTLEVLSSVLFHAHDTLHEQRFKWLFLREPNRDHPTGLLHVLYMRSRHEGMWWYRFKAWTVVGAVFGEGLEAQLKQAAERKLHAAQRGQQLLQTGLEGALQLLLSAPTELYAEDHECVRRELPDSQRRFTGLRAIIAVHRAQEHYRALRQRVEQAYQQQQQRRLMEREQEARARQAREAAEAAEAAAQEEAEGGGWSPAAGSGGDASPVTADSGSPQEFEETDGETEDEEDEGVAPAVVPAAGAVAGARPATGSHGGAAVAGTRSAGGSQGGAVVPQAGRTSAGGAVVVEAEGVVSPGVAAVAAEGVATGGVPGRSGAHTQGGAGPADEVVAPAHRRSV